MVRVYIGYVCLAAVGPAMVARAEAPRSIEQQVLATDDARMDALRRRDPRPLERIYADDYTLVTSLGEVKTKADQINQLKSGVLVADIRPIERRVRMYGDVAVVLSRQIGTIVQGGRQITRGDERVTRVYKNFNGLWKVIATHATTIQPDREP